MLTDIESSDELSFNQLCASPLLLLPTNVHDDIDFERQTSKYHQTNDCKFVSQ